MPPKLRPPQRENATRCRRFMGRLPPRLSPDALEVEIGSLPAGSHLPPALCKAVWRRPFPSSRAFSISRLLYTLPRGFVKGILGETLLFFVFPKAQGVKTSPSQVFSCTSDSFFKPQKGRGLFAPPANIISPESDCRRQRRCRCCESSRP